MDYLDNPERRRETEPSDRTSANNDGFGAASTPLTAKTQWCVDGMSSPLRSLFVGVKPAAAKRGVVDAGLEVGEQQRNNENRRPFQINPTQLSR
jgi:hypothetical protein